MPLSLIFLIVSILMVVGVISLTDAFLRLILHPKKSQDSVILFIYDTPCIKEEIIRKTVKKYPYSKITLHLSDSSAETKKMLEILQREYPNILIK